MKAPLKPKSLLISVWLFALAPLVLGQTIPFSWTRQFGTDDNDVAFGVAVDATEVYAVGYEDGVPPCQTGSDFQIAFVRKYSSNGTLLWTRTIGLVAVSAWGVAADSGVYVAGYTQEALPGQKPAGGVDAFVRKYDASGNEVWTRQFGTVENDVAFGVAVNATGVYVAGNTLGTLGQSSAGNADAFVRKYDASGVEQWTSQFGSAGHDTAVGVALDSTGVYVAGYTGSGGALPRQINSGAQDAFLRKYDVNGNEVWTSQFGTPMDEFGFGVAADATGVYLVGDTRGALAGQTHLGDADAFLRKYSSNGIVQWTRQFGTTVFNTALGVSVGIGGIFLGGYTSGALPGQTFLGQHDAYVRKYNASGMEIWTTQFGTSLSEAVWGVAADGGVYAGGCTTGTLPGQAPNAGNFDAFVVKNPQFPVGAASPGGGTATIKLGSQGSVPVAILSTATFDATTVDPMSITLAGAAVKLRGNGTYQAFAQDVNGDGRSDLVVQIATEALELSETDTEAVLEGMTFTGQAIKAKYFVRVVP